MNAYLDRRSMKWDQGQINHVDRHKTLQGYHIPNIVNPLLIKKQEIHVIKNYWTMKKVRKNGQMPEINIVTYGIAIQDKNHSAL